jgi:hypothetical protein
LDVLYGLRSNAINKEKNDKAFIINDQNPIKGTPKALEFCSSKQLEYDLFDKMEYSQFIEKLAEYDL